MKTKHIASMAVLAIGLLLTIFSIHEMKKLSTATQVVEDAKMALSGHSMGKRMSASMDAELAGADRKVKIALYSGILLIAIGGGALLFYRKR
jgi:hypothetical protein